MDTQDKPNFLWISNHDSSAWNYGCYGDQYADTPNIDRLAAEVCATPTRLPLVQSAHRRARVFIPACIRQRWARIITAAQSFAPKGLSC